MSEFQNSIQVILVHRFLFAYLVIVQAAFSILIGWLLRDLQLDRETHFILSISGGILAFSALCLGMVWMKIQPSLWLGLCLFICAALVLLVLGRSMIVGISWHIGALILFFIGILILRLVFIQDLLVPPYADSVQHFLIVQDFLNPSLAPHAFYKLSLNLQSYYHFGFHALAAWLSGSTATAPGLTISILGQYFQALVVLSIYPLARQVVKTSLGAWGVMILIGLILPMPAYASNWGKYPAIASLTGICFCMGLFAVLMHGSQAVRSRHWALLFAGVLITSFLHSRALLFFCVALLVFKLFFWQGANTSGRENKNEYPESMVVVAIFLGIAVYSNFLLLYKTYSMLVYQGLILSSIAAFYADLRRTSALLFFIMALGLLGITPLFANFFPGKFAILMDQPFLEIVLFFPVSLLFWLGLEGLIKFFTKNKIEKARPVAVLFLVIFGVINISYFQEQHPATCCIFMNDDDLFSFEWMKRNLPANTLVGIAATGSPGDYLPADGGAWIEPFTSIRTRKIKYDTDFVGALPGLCEQRIIYYYLDNLENSFDEYSLTKAGASYLFGFGSVRIYSANCDG